ncbi:MAG TPA: sugar phosphate nucleotidyltransferase [Terriglobales bacterium]|nr:sugar phosphate nucleotidyltransferase [Terriglobales bacterium]
MSIWGVIPAAGLGTRIQPLAFSKELLPVGTRYDGETERPRAVCEYLIDRMLQAGATRICFVISAEKTDILNYFGGQIGGAPICYAVQQNPSGLCDAIFTALPFLSPGDEVLVGLPDTVWFPEDAFQHLPQHKFSFLLFPVERPELFDAVMTDDHDRVLEVQVKTRAATTKWVWGAFRLPAEDLRNLNELWEERNRQDQYIGTLVNEYINRGAAVHAVRRGETYVDVGTLHGYREAVKLLSRENRQYTDEFNVAA